MHVLRVQSQREFRVLLTINNPLLAVYVCFVNKRYALNGVLFPCRIWRVSLCELWRETRTRLTAEYVGIISTEYPVVFSAYVYCFFFVLLLFNLVTMCIHVPWYCEVAVLRFVANLYIACGTNCTRGRTNQSSSLACRRESNRRRPTRNRRRSATALSGVLLK